MNEDQVNLNQLSEKLNGLMKRQESFQKEIEELRSEIRKLAAGPAEGIVVEPVVAEPLMPKPLSEEPGLWKAVVEKTVSREKESPRFRANLEKFIGENLINKIGIVILVIGVGIGAKYAIDHDLISPLTRIILGYIVGLGLMGFAIRLKKQYENFSAVLLSGAMAIMYFITFAAYSFFELIPLTLTFSLMALFTVFTVVAAITYNMQVIAHIGLVGAYAVPFLLSDGSGKVAILFSYMAIINAGILSIAVMKYWKPLYYSSFLLTWLIFITWFIPKYEDAGHFALAWVFISVFFVTFYLIFLSYKLLKKEKFRIDDILLLLANSSVFYALGYALLRYHLGGEKFQGLFTLGNGLIHFIVCIIILRWKESDRNLFYFTVGLVISFITISVPVQLHGNWVTMLWAAEAAVLFHIGRKGNTAVYELLSYALMILAFFSLILGWPEVYHTSGEWPEGIKFITLFNINFLTSALFIASFAYINVLNLNKKFISPLSGQHKLNRLMNFIIPGMLLIVLYFTFYMEISAFWNQRIMQTVVKVNDAVSGVQIYTNDNITQYKTITLLAYSLLFLSLLSWVNIKKLKNSLLGLINLGFSLAAVGLFLTVGLIALGTLRESYLSQELPAYFYRGFMLVGIRYVAFGFLALMLFAVYRYVQEEFLGTGLKMEFDIFLHVVLLTVASNELINWMDLSGAEDSFKLGLSILFGLYSVFLIILGIWKKKIHLRISAIVLFSLTLLKLFFYDLSSLSTIGKTIVFVVLGVLLLIISFLYTKYRHVIFEDGKEE